MYLFSFNFSKNNLLTEQVNFDSLYDLPVMNKLLIEHQLINFTDLPIEKAFLVDCTKKIDFPFYDTISIDENNIYKELLLVDNEKFFIAFRNDVYFEFDNISSVIKGSDELFSLEDGNGLIFCILGSVGQLKSLYNKSVSIYDIFRQKYTRLSKNLSSCYVKQLDSIKTYKGLLFDILNSKTFFKPPFIAEGIFTEDVVPEGDFSIVPPVYFGKGVQIESGAVIGPNTVIYDYSLISNNTSIKNSVLFGSVYISSNCFIDGTICCDNSSIKRNTAVFSGSVIGADALIGEDMTIENGSVINKDIRYDKFNTSAIKKNQLFSFTNKFQGLSPDKVALLGSAVAIVLKKPKVIVGCDSYPNSLSLKLAFLSGLIASGCRCIDVGVTFKSQMFFSLRYCDCDFSAFFTGRGGGTDIEIYNSQNETLTKTDCCNLFDFCNKGKFIFESSDEDKNIRQIKGLKKMYIREITAFSFDDLPYVDNVVCKNKILLKTLNEIFDKCTKKDNKKNNFTIYMNENGTNVNIKYKNKFYSQKTLKKLVFFYAKINRNINAFESDLYKSLWRYDSVILVMSVFNIIKYSGKELDILIHELPQFFTKTANVNYKCNNSDIAEKISSKFLYNYRNGTFNIKSNDNYIKVINDRDNENLKIITSSKSMAFSEELCNYFKTFLTQ